MCTQKQSAGKKYRTDLATQGHRRKQGLDRLNLYVYLHDLDLPEVYFCLL